ncbi:hypothetical protein MUO14_20010 [Halobacillus shinanisalinarum]|uniref:Uncharacterized protein n=1 Tax=Halobacillus shinanisalinarum TaxID=2932258 RepID=A0ABY4GX90_9BACI|nr:hypothetical protein [Halobacillus shinanisalinarum]UOQ92679.1 hypothetical protein MUO14_20010 [Halobacillus shinanisalinarum]
MTERHWLWMNLGGVSAFGLFILISLCTAINGPAQGAIVVISEIIGILIFIFAVLTLFYIKDRQRWFAISILSFVGVWIAFGIGYEMSIDAQTNNSWIWFYLYYVAFIASIVLLKFSYAKIRGLFKLTPIFFIFFNAMLTLYMVTIHIWYLLPFSE